MDSQTSEIIKALTAEIRSCVLLCKKEWLTIDEFAQVSGYKPNSIRKMCAEGRLTYSKPEGSKIIYINQKEFNRVLSMGKVRSIFDMTAKI